ncbi:hypothetical protein GCM10009664_69530 [Kitasatospora gansuensis]
MAFGYAGTELAGPLASVDHLDRPPWSRCCHGVHLPDALRGVRPQVGGQASYVTQYAAEDRSRASTAQGDSRPAERVAILRGRIPQGGKYPLSDVSCGNTSSILG